MHLDATVVSEGFVLSQTRHHVLTKVWFPGQVLALASNLLTISTFY
jgi:hypothetical protein